MDAKEIKACLKAAREAIRNKEFKDAAKQCKVSLGLLTVKIFVTVHPKFNPASMCGAALFIFVVTRVFWYFPHGWKFSGSSVFSKPTAHSDALKLKT